MNKMGKLIILGSALWLGGCATNEQVSIEHTKAGMTVIHHKSHSGNADIDRMECVSKDGHVRTIEMKQADESPMSATGSKLAVAKPASDVRAMLVAARQKQATLRQKLADAKAHSDEAQTAELQTQLETVQSDNDKMQQKIDAMMGVKHTEAAQ